MLKIGQPLSSTDTTALKDFLDSPSRPDDTLSFHELQGYLFAIASSPETISPSEWMPMSSNDEERCYGGDEAGNQVVYPILQL